MPEEEKGPQFPSGARGRLRSGCTRPAVERGFFCTCTRPCRDSKGKIQQKRVKIGISASSAMTQRLFSGFYKLGAPLSLLEFVSVACVFHIESIICTISLIIS